MRLRRSRATEAQSRRLSGAQDVVREAFLEIYVSSRRHTATFGRSRIQSYLPNAAEASQLLGLAVHSLEWLEDVDALDARGEMSEEAAPGEDGDLYAPFYEEVVPPPDGHILLADDGGSGSTIAGVPVDGVPTMFIIGGAASLLTVGFALAVCWRLRKWRRLHNQEMTVRGRVVQKAMNGDADDPKATTAEHDEGGGEHNLPAGASQGASAPAQGPNGVNEDPLTFADVRFEENFDVDHETHNVHEVRPTNRPKTNRSAL